VLPSVVTTAAGTTGAQSRQQSSQAGIQPSMRWMWQRLFPPDV